MTTNCCISCDVKAKCFDKLTIENLTEVNENHLQTQYKKGEIIAKQGTFENRILYIRQGYVKLYKEINEKKDLIINIIPKGTLIGITSLFGDRKIFSYTVVALSNVSVCSIDINIIEKQIKQNGDFAASIIRAINLINSNYLKKYIASTQKQLNGRLAELLIHLSENVFYSTQYNFLLSRKEIAELLGVATMSLVRTLKDFKKNNLIKLSGNKIEILELKKLEKISQNG